MLTEPEPETVTSGCNMLPAKTSVQTGRRAEWWKNYRQTWQLCWHARQITQRVHVTCSLPISEVAVGYKKPVWDVQVYSLLARSTVSSLFLTSSIAVLFVLLTSVMSAVTMEAAALPVVGCVQGTRHQRDKKKHFLHKTLSSCKDTTRLQEGIMTETDTFHSISSCDMKMIPKLLF